MKASVLIPVILLLFACSQQSEQPEKNSNTVPEELSESDNQDDADEIIDAELPPAAHQILLKMAGNYFVLDTANSSYFYTEECTYNEGEITINQKLDNVAFWEINWYGEPIEIHSVQESENNITISNLEADLAFVFIKSTTEFVYDFIVSGYRDVRSITHENNINQFEAIPCDNISRIISDLPETWYTLTEIEGEEVIFYPCYAPDVIIMDGETIDFSSGSDPYPIESIEKLFNRIVVRYMPADNILDSIIINRVNENIYTISTDESNAKRYVREEAIGLYKEVNEGCE